MESTNLSPFEQATHDIPVKWFESGMNKQLGYILNTALIPASIGLVMSGYDDIKYHLVAAGLFTASAVADRIGTYKWLSNMENAEKKGIKAMHIETNPSLPDILNSKTFNFHPALLIADIIGTAATFAFPLLSITYSGPKFMATLANLNTARRYRRAAELTQNQ